MRQVTRSPLPWRPCSSSRARIRRRTARPRCPLYRRTRRSPSPSCLPRCAPLTYIDPTNLLCKYSYGNHLCGMHSHGMLMWRALATGSGDGRHAALAVDVPAAHAVPQPRHHPVQRRHDRPHLHPGLPVDGVHPAIPQTVSMPDSQLV